MSTPNFSITPAAAIRVQELARAEGNPNLMLRIDVSGGGCSGFKYGFGLESDSRPDDLLFDQHGVKVVVDEVSLELLSGSQLDYVDDLMAAAFRVSNPNATSTCGCGTSFSM